MRADMSDWGVRLAKLRGFDPPAAAWRGVLAARRRRHAQQSLRWPALAAAVIGVIVVGAGWRLQATAREPVADRGGGAVAVRVAVEMRAENERLEWMLAVLPERRALRGSTAFTLAELEDRLALVDDRLSRVALEPNAPERVEELWRERVEVMNSLVQVRYADSIGTY